MKLENILIGVLCGYIVLALSSIAIAILGARTAPWEIKAVGVVFLVAVVVFIWLAIAQIVFNYIEKKGEIKPMKKTYIK